MTFLLICVAFFGWILAVLFLVLFLYAAVGLGVINAQLIEAKQDLEVYKNTANVFGRNSQGRFRAN